MKIIATDSYARESVADILMAENVSERHAKMIEKSLQDTQPMGDDRWFIAVTDDYRLSRGMEDLV